MSNPESPAAPKQTLTGKNHGLYTKWWKSGHKSQDVSPVLWPVGMTSPDGDALLGRDGFVFLTGGSNNLADQYNKAADEVAPIAKKWTRLIKQRSHQMSQQNVVYLQFIVPEKLSILPDAFPAEISVPSTLLSELERLVQDDTSLSDQFVSCYKLFRDHPRRRQLYRKVDTHASPIGCYEIAQMVLAKLRQEPLPQLPFERQCADFADLGGRMGGILDTYFECDPEWAGECLKVSEFTPESGHAGKKQSWTCTDARCDLKVLAFGNSFFEFAERGQGSLTWWMARTFKKFDFVWSPNLDLDIVREVNPDVVICQSVERFLTQVPTY